MNDSTTKILGKALSQKQLLLLRVGLLALTVLFLSPILLAGLYHDDLYLVTAYQGIDKGVLESTLDAVQNTWNAGRFFPLNLFAVEIVFRLFDHENRWLYHLAQMVAIGACYLLFLSYMARRLWDQKAGVFFYTASLLLLFGITSVLPQYHDPFVAYHFQQPLFFACFFLSVIFLDKHLHAPSGVRYLLASLLLYAFAICLYEIAYPMILVYLVMIVCSQPRNFRLWLVYGLLFAVLVGFQFYLRSNAVVPDSYEGISLSLSPADVLSTFVNQAFTATPLSWLVGRVFNKAIQVTGVSQLRLLFDLAFLLMLFALAFWLVRGVMRSRSDKSYLALIGFLLWVLPALPIALSAKYQSELSLTAGYLPRFFQGFGFVMMVVPLFLSIRYRALVLAGLGMVACAVFCHNILRIQDSNERYRSALFINQVLSNDTFIAEVGASRVFVRDSYIHDKDAYLAVNPDIPVIDKDLEQLVSGDSTLIFYERPQGSEFAYWGTWQEDGRVHHLHRVERAGLSPSVPVTYEVAGYVFIPLKETPALADLLQQTLE